MQVYKSRSFSCYCNATIRLLFLHNKTANAQTPITHCLWFHLDISWDVLVLLYGWDWKLFAVWNVSNYILNIGPVPQSCHYWSHTNMVIKFSSGHCNSKLTRTLMKIKSVTIFNYYYDYNLAFVTDCKPCNIFTIQVSYNTFHVESNWMSLWVGRTHQFILNISKSVLSSKHSYLASLCLSCFIIRFNLQSSELLFWK